MQGGDPLFIAMLNNICIIEIDDNSETMLKLGFRNYKEIDYLKQDLRNFAENVPVSIHSLLKIYHFY